MPGDTVLTMDTDLPTPHPNNAIALLCTLHTSNAQSKSKILNLLSSARTYYTSKKSQCTTWSYFTPAPKGACQLIPKSDRDTTIFGVEMYSDKAALQTQQGESWYMDFQKRTKEEGLFSEKGEVPEAWYPAAGFVARDERDAGIAKPFGQGVIVMLAVFTCKEGKRDEVVGNIGKYTGWVAANESGVLTYCTMTRPKAPNQVLLFERYQDSKALGAHGSTKEFKAMFKSIAPLIEVKQTKLQQCSELDNAFVGNVVGPGELVDAESKSKL